jgi:uncharacterized protein (DUF2164 family)
MPQMEWPVLGRFEPGATRSLPTPCPVISKQETAMKPIKFSREETSALVGEIQEYFREELDQDIGMLPAEMLMRFFGEKMGAYFYNRGLYNAQALIRKRMDSLTDDVLALEQPTKHLR